MAQSQICKLGKSTILVHDAEFKNGYYSGLFGHLNQAQPLTVEAIRTMIQESVTDVSQAEDWNTGYIAGAISGLHEGSCKL